MITTMVRLTFILLLSFVYNYLLSQAPVGDCIGAIPVCQNIYTETDSPVGPGNNANEIASTNCVITESNSVWYVFTVQGSGDLGFLITPNVSSDDYDWSLFNITGKSCSDILNDPSLVASCNAAGGNSGSMTCNGITGANNSTTYNYQNFGCGNNPPTANGGFSALNAFVPVLTGETYVLALINWTGSDNGYTIYFDLGDAEILDMIQPNVAEFYEPALGDCNITEIPISFSENILCSTFDGSQIIITGPGGPYFITTTSLNCENGGLFDNQFLLNFDPPIDLAGTYTITVNPSATDICGNLMTSFTTSFEIIDDLGTHVILDTLICKDESLIIDASINVDSTYYLWNTGSIDSKIKINGAGEYVVEITHKCFVSTEIYRVNYLDPAEFDQLIINDYSCENALGSAEFIVSGTGPISITVDSFTSNSPFIFDDLQAGTYDVVLTDGLGCNYDTTITISTIPSNVSINTNGDTTIFYEGTAEITAEVIGNNQGYYWTADTTLACDNCLSMTVNPEFTTQYIFTVLDSLGCEISDSVLVRVEVSYDVYSPNVFSPNNDGINDKFTLFANGQLINIKILEVYNRWGEKMYEAENLQPNNPNLGWDGTFKDRKVNPGVYSWRAEVVFIDGFVKTMYGSITIL